MIGKSRVSVTNTLRLLKLPKEIQEAIKQGKISFSHGRALLEIGDSHQQLRLAQLVVARDLSVRELENLIKMQRPKRIRLKTGLDKSSQDPYLVLKEEMLQQVLGTKVKIRRTRKRGCIQIEFYSAEDLERVFKILTNQ